MLKPWRNDPEVVQPQRKWQQQPHADGKYLELGYERNTLLEFNDVNRATNRLLTGLQDTRPFEQQIKSPASPRQYALRGSPRQVAGRLPSPRFPPALSEMQQLQNAI
jgi:hypothetical protein